MRQLISRYICELIIPTIDSPLEIRRQYLIVTGNSEADGSLTTGSLTTGSFTTDHSQPDHSQPDHSQIGITHNWITHNRITHNRWWATGAETDSMFRPTGSPSTTML